MSISTDRFSTTSTSAFGSMRPLGGASAGAASVADSGLGEPQDSFTASSADDHSYQMAAMTPSQMARSVGCMGVPTHLPKLDASGKFPVNPEALRCFGQ